MKLRTQTNLFKRFCRTFPSLGLANPRNRKCQFNICQNSLMRNQIITLENKSYRMITIRIPVSVFIFLRWYSIDDQISAVISVQTTNDIQKRCLSRTTRSQNSNKFIISEIQTDIIQCFLYQITCSIFLANMLYLKHAFSPFPITIQPLFYYSTPCLDELSFTL